MGGCHFPLGGEVPPLRVWVGTHSLWVGVPPPDPHVGVGGSPLSAPPCGHGWASPPNTGIPRPESHNRSRGPHPILTTRKSGPYHGSGCGGIRHIANSTVIPQTSSSLNSNSNTTQQSKYNISHAYKSPRKLDVLMPPVPNTLKSQTCMGTMCVQLVDKMLIDSKQWLHFLIMIRQKLHSRAQQSLTTSQKATHAYEPE